ncbi:MAG: methyltransferase domain-containing protein [Anaerolineaceae bacterium]|nr:methyltransferase domain-containing protein [Anaerolineaceae bacterium]
MGVETFFEVAVIEGLEPVAAQELHHRLGDQVRLFYPAGQYPGVIQFVYGGTPHNLLNLKTVLSLFWVMRFPAPRPRALLGHQALQMIFERTDEIRKFWPKTAFKTLYLAAAGSDSGVMERIAAEIAAHNELTVTREEGDLLVRLRRPLDGSPGWEIALRMAPRPLSVRPWRVCDLKGALNAAVAQAMVQFTRPRSEDVFLNIGCGSGTLLIERATSAPVREAIGCDTDPTALECAGANVTASKQGARIRLEPWDARSLPLSTSSVDVICADLPFGHDVGSHMDNLALYPLLLQEAARVARPAARCVFLTHEIRLMSDLLENSPEWKIEEVIQISLTGLHPKIYIVERMKQ